MKLRYLLISLSVAVTLALHSSCDLLSRTEYEVANNTPYELSLSFYEFDVNQQEISMTTAYFNPGQTQSFTPMEGAVAVKVYIPDYGQWVQRIFYINKGKTTYILITPDIPTGHSMP